MVKINGEKDCTERTFTFWLPFLWTMCWLCKNCTNVCVQFWFSVLSNQIQTLSKTETILGLHLCSMYVLLEHVLWKCISLHVLQLLHNYYIVMCNCDFLRTVFRVTQIFKGRLVKLNLLGFLNLKNILSEKRPLCNYIINPLEILVLCQMRHE